MGALETIIFICDCNCDAKIWMPDVQEVDLLTHKKI